MGSWKVRRAAAVAAIVTLAAGAAPTVVGAAPGVGQRRFRRPRPCSSPPTACARTSSSSTRRDGLMPEARSLLRSGAVATDGGLLTQAPPNTGAGWYTLATGAWPGVTGSTNNTFHVNGQPFANRTAAFDPACSRPSRSPSRPSGAGSRSPRSSGPAGEGPPRDRPSTSVTFLSGRGVATNYIVTGMAAVDDANFTPSFGLQFDHPAGFAGNAPSPRRPRPRPPAG